MNAAQYLFGCLRDAGVTAIFGSADCASPYLAQAEAAGLQPVILPTQAEACSAARVYGRLTGASGVVLDGASLPEGVAPPQPGPGFRAALRLDVAQGAPDVVSALLVAAHAGPVTLSLAPQAAEEFVQPEVDPKQIEPHIEVAVPQGPIDEAALLLSLAARPVIWAGDGAVRAGAAAELAAVAEMLGAPVLTGISGKGAMSESHPLALGALFEAREVARLLRDSDAAVAVGTGFSARSTRSGQLPMPLQLFHIDLDPQVVGRRFPARLGITGEAKAVLIALAQGLRAKPAGNQLVDPAASASGVRDAARQRLQGLAGGAAALIDTLRAAIPDEVPTLWDSAAARWAVPLFAVPVPGTFHPPGETSSPGSSLPGLLGAAAGQPGAAVAVLTVAELAAGAESLPAIAASKSPLVIVLTANDAWAGADPLGELVPAAASSDALARAGQAGLSTLEVDQAGLAGAVQSALAGTAAVLLSLTGASPASPALTPGPAGR